MVYFAKKSAKITVFLADFSPKMTKVGPKYVAWGCIQDGVVFTRIRYIKPITELVFHAKIYWPDFNLDDFNCVKVLNIPGENSNFLFDF